MALEGELTGEINNLEGFVEAARNYYGIEGMTWHKEGDNSVLEQKVGEGWPGLGYDKKGDVGRLWVGLTPDGHRINQGNWNENTLLEEGKEYKGIISGQEGMIDSKHPLAELYRTLQKTNPDLQFHVTGEHAEWQTDERTKLTFDEQGNLLGNIPVGKEIKTVVTPVQANWTDGGWKKGALQRLEIRANPM
jgi:hypothetical protein